MIKTNDGIEGIGETSYDPDTVESFILGEASDYLLGKNPSQIDLLWGKTIKSWVSYKTRKFRRDAWIVSYRYGFMGPKS
ncbi:MAG: hypothetical protein Ct9H90mP2_10480 [Dehalococcoidia bacterium]|nr:MAG: hypothetical protein Ct9H90mP2_10480 [Dehalococcoidia bacterium]